VLSPDVWGDVDLGPDGPPRGVVRGAPQVARNLLRFWGPEVTLVSQPIDGRPALLAFRGTELSGVLVFAIRGERIESVHVIADPRKLGLLLPS
jgi:RNA polymerase sigma-70 factor, ECF subfamily